MSDVDDILTMPEAGEIAGRTAEAMKKAAQRGALEARRVGSTGQRGVWVTTRSAVVAYMARARARAHFLPRDERGHIMSTRGWDRE